MKNKNVVIVAVIILLLLLLGAGAYLMLNKSGTSPKVAADDFSPSKSEQTSKSLLDLIKMGQDLRCTFSTKLTNGSTEGTVYVSGTNLRGDFNVTTDDGTKMQTSMIKNGDTSYIWGSNMEGKGIKMTLSLEKLTENKEASQQIDPNQKLNYNCSPWNVDASLFTVPTNIEFTDMTSLMMPKESGAQTTQPDASNPCSQLTDETTKAACENALKQSGQ